MMAAATMPPKIQTFVYFDLEGTGLPSQPADSPVRIIELSMVAVQRLPGVGGGDTAPAERQRSEPAAGRGGLEHLPPTERGLVTPKRPIREHDRLAAAGLSRARARPRMNNGCATPLVSDGTSEDEEEEEEEAPRPVPTPPRVRNSLLLPVSPRKQISAIITDITALDNETLEPHSGFDRDLADMVRLYLRRLPGPVCLVAHNGNRYDFPLLNAELLHVEQTWFDSTSDLLCVDSLEFFRAVAAGTDRPERPRAAGDTAIYALDPTTLSCCHDAEDDGCVVCNPGMWLTYDECATNAQFEFTRVGGRRAIRCLHADGERCVVCKNEAHYRRPPPRVRRRLFPGQGRTAAGGGPKPSLKLPDLYQRRFGVPPELSHSAADDVEALLLLCLSHGERFFDWADRNRSPLGHVKPMWSRSPRRAPPPPRAPRSHRVLPAW